MAPAYRFVEACALLPMLFVPERENVVLCTGAQAEVLAADCLRWKDIKTVYLTSPPIRLDALNPALNPRRLVVTQRPPLGSCSAILMSPGEDPDPYIAALAPDGIISVTRDTVTELQPMMWHMRRLFPHRCLPWREFLPNELYGCLASPRGVPKRQRNVPKGAKRLNNGYIQAMLTFAADELSLVIASSSVKTDVTAKA